MQRKGATVILHIKQNFHADKSVSKQVYSRQRPCAAAIRRGEFQQRKTWNSGQSGVLNTTIRLEGERTAASNPVEVGNKAHRRARALILSSLLKAKAIRWEGLVTSFYFSDKMKHFKGLLSLLLFFCFSHDRIADSEEWDLYYTCQPVTPNCSCYSHDKTRNSEEWDRYFAFPKGVSGEKQVSETLSKGLSFPHSNLTLSI